MILREIAAGLLTVLLSGLFWLVLFAGLRKRWRRTKGLPWFGPEWNSMTLRDDA